MRSSVLGDGGRVGRELADVGILDERIITVFKGHVLDLTILDERMIQHRIDTWDDEDDDLGRWPTRIGGVVAFMMEPVLGDLDGGHDVGGVENKLAVHNEGHLLLEGLEKIHPRSDVLEELVDLGGSTIVFGALIMEKSLVELLDVLVLDLDAGEGGG